MHGDTEFVGVLASMQVLSRHRGAGMLAPLFKTIDAQIV
jgi:hypothetical protein